LVATQAMAVSAALLAFWLGLCAVFWWNRIMTRSPRRSARATGMVAESNAIPLSCLM